MPVLKTAHLNNIFIPHMGKAIRDIHAAHALGTVYKDRLIAIRQFLWRILSNTVLREVYCVRNMPLRKLLRRAHIEDHIALLLLHKYLCLIGRDAPIFCLILAFPDGVPSAGSLGERHHYKQQDS